MPVKKDQAEKPEPNQASEPDLGAPDFSQFADAIEIKPEDIERDEPTSKKKKALPVGDAIAMFSSIMFSFVAARKGEHWKLNAEEAEELASASEDCINEYFPDFHMSPIWTLAGVSVAIAAPRLLIDAKIAQQAAQEQAKAQAQTQTDVDTGGEHERQAAKSETTE